VDIQSLQDVRAALNLLAEPSTRVQFSQFGEDVIIESMLETFGLSKRCGFYVDIGAHHPSYLSNTKLLYLKGWHGVNIDANESSIALFNRERPRDRNIHCMISNDAEEAEFVSFEDTALNTADPAAISRVTAGGRARIVGTQRMRARRLGEVLAQSVPQGVNIDLMSVDVEGYDLRVLQSNDWEKFAPFFLLVEDPDMSFLLNPKTKISTFLQPYGYRLISQAFITSIYVHDQV
jgi:FkbM family methyltransferase